MKTFLSPYTDFLYAAFRFIAGVLFVFHGTQKIFGAPGDRKPVADYLSLSGTAGLIEIVCGTLIAIGLFGAWAAFIASGTMAVAYFMRHAPDGFFPIVNRGELAVLYCFAFLFMAAYGSGRYSVDHLRSRDREANRSTLSA